MIGYMIIPLGLTDEQEHIYIKLYKKCDFNSMTVKYTVDQLVKDSYTNLNLTTKKIRNIIKFLLDEGYIQEVKKGSKGNPTTYKIIAIQDLNDNKMITKGQLKGNQRAIKGQLKGKQNLAFKPFIEVEGQLKGNQRAIKGQPYQRKRKRKRKRIYMCIC